MRYALFLLAIITLFACKTSKTYQVQFKVDMSEIREVEKVYVQGDVEPLSWKDGFGMSDPDGDGTYEANVKFVTKKKSLKYKFRNGNNWELAGADNRTLRFESGSLALNTPFDEYEYYSAEKIEQLTYTPEQIKSDVAILRKTIQYVHPNLYKYQSEADLENDFQNLEAAMLAEPTLVNAYKEVSKFAAKIECSHTFTNPWNQGSRIKKAIFFQPDKVPFTFSRIGKRLFIDKNASDEEALKTGREVLDINGTPSRTILERLMPYVSADGTNDEKRLQRLTITGNNKYELFDIFYPIEFGSVQKFNLKLFDHITGDTVDVLVNAISKTRRDANLRVRYPDFNNTIADAWRFDWQADSTAYLKMQSFAIFDNSFDWKGFLNNAFAKINEKKAQHLILDIRGNEGGNDEIVEYLLLKILNKSVTLPAPQSIVNYKSLPDELSAYVSTWSKLPFNWGATVEELRNGQYQMKERFGGRIRTYEPAKDHFRGQVYLLVDASNSSATQILATYMKAYNLATIIGQTTGGNQRGLTGGYMFFHRLPNTGIEIDLPLVATSIFPLTDETPNGGLEPDVVIEKNITDFIKGIDTELQATLKLIQKSYAVK
jgi:hypothetical protein